MACPCSHLRVRHFLLLILTSLLSFAALFLAASTGERRRLGAARFNESELLAFVGSDADAEQEKRLIKDLLQDANPEPHRGRAATRNPPPDPHFHPLLRARLTSLLRPFDAKVMQTLATTIKTPLTKEPRRYSSCAVVGNSGILLNATHGAAIDAHEAVVRLNNARTAGFELHVGRRTTIAFMNSNVLHRCARRLRCYCEAYGGPVPIVLYVSQVQHLMDVATCKRVQSAPLLVTDPRFDALTARIAKWYSVRESGGVREWEWKEQGFHYSSGLQAVLLALGICEQVDLFGFGKANRTKHHYHTAQVEELHIHDYAAEYVFYGELVRREDVPFLRDAEIRLPRLSETKLGHTLHKTFVPHANVEIDGCGLPSISSGFTERHVEAFEA